MSVPTVLLFSPPSLSRTAGLQARQSEGTSLIRPILNGCDVTVLPSVNKYEEIPTCVQVNTSKSAPTAVSHMIYRCL